MRPVLVRLTLLYAGVPGVSPPFALYIVRGVVNKYWHASLGVT